ncbi:hypothetical protein CKO42_03860 [Lamprobacter modestohalophilus]|uniref:Uncharacterized protein n=1 Tax=Lamprobacter modestohalophilus TaxID=1064514 RepID=A0A9X0W6A1_9GAMM|nr:hypothetical protein [Lamprobacter modestohalophilus]MBK1617601.1 hypothetical protein [Lamprobacter modestohalophilus]
MNPVIIANTNPNIELVEVRDFDDNMGQVIRYQPIVAWAVDPEKPGEPAKPITTDGHGLLWGLHDRATGRAWVPDAQSGELHHTLAYLGWGDKEEVE